MHFTIDYRRKGTKQWNPWRFCGAAKVATWKDEKKAYAYCARLEASNPDFEYRVTGWIEAFSIPR